MPNGNAPSVQFAVGVDKENLGNMTRLQTEECGKDTPLTQHQRTRTCGHGRMCISYDTAKGGGANQDPLNHLLTLGLVLVPPTVVQPPYSPASRQPPARPFADRSPDSGLFDVKQARTRTGRTRN